MKQNRNRNLGRRTFLQRGAGLAVVAAAGAGRASLAGSEASTKVQSKEPDFIIDSHIHCGGTDAWVDEMLRVFRPRKVIACVLTRMEHMELMRKAAQDHPDVFIPYGRVDLDDENAVREVEAFHKNGFVGMKFHSPQKDYDDPGYFQVYRCANTSECTCSFTPASPTERSRILLGCSRPPKCGPCSWTPLRASVPRRLFKAPISAIPGTKRRPRRSGGIRTYASTLPARLF